MAEFIFRSNAKAVREIALTGAIGLMAGMAGASYHVSGTGLNQYIILVAKSGTGKGNMAKGIDLLLNQMDDIRYQQFQGPRDFASAKGLLNAFKKSQSFVSIQSEFGKRLAALYPKHPNALAADRAATMLEIYDKSGPGLSMKLNSHADINNNTETFKSPALTLLWETQPSTFFSAINENNVIDGFLPRFIIVEYKGEALYDVDDFEGYEATSEFKIRFKSFASKCLSQLGLENGMKIHFEPDAAILAKQFSNSCVDKNNESKNPVHEAIWGRANVTSLKLAGLYAVGEDWFNPTIKVKHLEWAQAIVVHTVEVLLHRFDKGQIGDSDPENDQLKEVCSAIVKYFSGQLSKGYNAKQKYIDGGMFEYSVILTIVAARPAFKRARIKNDTKNLADVMKNLIDRELIKEVNINNPQFVETYGATRAKLYTLNEPETTRLQQLLEITEC